MRLTSFLLPALAAASPVARQVAPAEIATLVASGPGCPSGSFEANIAPDGKSVTYGFNSYAVEIGPGASPSNREKYCDLTIGVRFPVGCSTATLRSTYHGFAQLGTGVTGTFQAQYNLSPGSLTSGANPAPAVISSAGFGGAGNVYTKVDSPVARVSVTNPNQRIVNFTVRSRIFLQSNNQSSQGLLTDDDLSVEIVGQGTC
ncbi:hypothetical protein OQA88_8897 [Cercophora sp. LCS_1]